PPTVGGRNPVKAPRRRRDVAPRDDSPTVGGRNPVKAPRWRRDVAPRDDSPTVGRRNPVKAPPTATGRCTARRFADRRAPEPCEGAPDGDGTLPRATIRRPSGAGILCRRPDGDY